MGDWDNEETEMQGSELLPTMTQQRPGLRRCGLELCG